MNILKPLLALAALAASPTVSAQVVLSEIHYHPVEEEAFNANGTPILDLTEDRHEFVEIQNAGFLPVNLSGWTISGGVTFTFPANTSIPAGGYLVVAADPARITAVYGVAAASVLGPYVGHLGNSGDNVRLSDNSGVTKDQVNYSSSFPWPTAADALGAQERFTGLKNITYQYKGRSLQRVSVTSPGNDPANWLASPLLPGPTPGGAQAVSLGVPKPIVIGQNVVQDSDGEEIVRANEPARVTATFSSTESLTGVQVEFFQDDVNTVSETRASLNMTSVGGGVYTAVLPPRGDRAIVRYRIRANRGDGLEIVSPRADDAKVAPTGPSGTREAWFGYFVTPTRVSTRPIYDVFLSTASNAVLTTNTNTFPERVTALNENGVPREDPYVAPGAPHWNGTEPAVFCFQGKVWDIHMRHHGSRYHRTTTRNSYKFHFPEYLPFNGVTSLFETDKDWRTSEGQGIWVAAGFPVSSTRSVDMYLNNGALLVRLEQGEYDGTLLDEFHKTQFRLNPSVPKEVSGEMYKSEGNIDGTGNNFEGPYTRGDVAPIANNAGWQSLQRFDYTYKIQSHGWKGAVPIKALVDGMWTARGDTFGSPNINTTNARTWCDANLDMNSVLTSLALINWMGAWDDVCHNQFYWRRVNGKWSRISWDFDDLMTSQRITQDIFVGETGADDPFFGPNWFKDTILKTYRNEFRQKLWELNNSLLDPVNLNALGYPNSATFATQRQTNVNSQLGLGAYTKPARPTNSSPATGSIVISTTANFTTSAYSHPGGSAHVNTKWEVRAAGGNYANPVFLLTSTTQRTTLPVPVDQLVYGQTYFWRVTYTDAQGHPSVVSAETSFSYGNPNPSAGNIVLHEIMAANAGAVTNGGTFPDYIEIRNNNASQMSVAGFTLTNDTQVLNKYTFPPGTTIPGNSFLMVYCDSDTAAPGLHSGFKLNAEGETLVLLNGNTIVDSVTFGPQAENIPMGRATGNGGWTLVNPSPGAANVVQTFGAATDLRINEWQAAPRHGDDWFEIYNTGAKPVNLAGLFLTDDLSDPTNTKVPALSFIAPGGFVRFQADNSTGTNHCNFGLSGGGDNLYLIATDGGTLIDFITFGPQAVDASGGRLPDGGPAIVTFATTPSPAASNWLPGPVLVNEVLTNSTAPFEDAIELVNTSNSPVNIGGWWLSDDRGNFKKFQIPADTIVPAKGHLVLYESLFGGVFSLSSFGDELVLSAESNGLLTGFRSQVSFGAAADGVSFGRVPLVGVPDEFWPLKSHTFGADTPADVETFRTGTGGANAAPLTGPIIINELQYQPPLLAGLDNARDEFIELHNISGQAVDVSGWVLKGDIDFTFAPGTSIPSGAYVLVVTFDPSNAATLAQFKATYSLGAVTVFGPYTPKLDNEAARIELSRPGVPENGVTPLLLVDKVDYKDFAPWPYALNQSIQRRGRYVIGNDPSNWVVSSPRPAAVNAGQPPFVPPASAGFLIVGTSTSTAPENVPSVTVTVKRVGGAAGAVSVDYDATSGSATAGADYGVSTGTLNFADGETTKTFTIPLVNDSEPEFPETFDVVLSNPTGGAVLDAPAVQTITITDNDNGGGGAPGVLQFALGSLVVPETVASGEKVISVIRTGGSSGTVTVQVVQDTSNTALPNATPGADFGAVLPIVLTFEEGETSKSFVLPIFNDDQVESNERLRLALTNVDGGAKIGAGGLQDLILTSDDVPPPYTPVKAGYTGLVNEFFSRQGYGFITLTTTTTGAITGKITTDGVTYPFSGKFDGTGQFRRTIKVKNGKQIFDRILFLRMIDGVNHFDGDFGGYTVSGERNAVGATKTPVDGAGKYTAVLREGGEPVGSLTLTIAATGSVKYTGSMGDGIAVTGSSALSQTRRLPICSGLYTGKKGFLFGPGELAASGTPRAYAADLIWSKPAPPKPTGVYPNGFPSRLVALDGALFTPPAKGARLLPQLLSANVDLDAGNLTAPIGPMAITISEKNKFVVPLNAQKLTLTLTPTTGTFKGTFKHTDGKVRTIKGVVVQQDAGDGPGVLEGVFPGTDTGGTVKITAPGP